ncbi:phosphoribosyltransferase family protein [Cyanobium sp. FGCU-6]|jgi:putative phosphoribosyl transferase|nr:phosphoribosyltransferase family protein [Cyanobium sp. FGCU6]
MIASDAFWSDRRTAGLALAARLRDLPPHPAGSVVVALPRGGVVVGAEVARALQLPLTTWSVRKLALPTQPEVALGALAPGGVILWDPHTAWMFDEHPVLRDQVVEREGRELERRRLLYGDADPSALTGRQLIVVDDGIATGLSVRAALTSLQRLGPARVVLAAPVAAHQSLPALRELVDELVLLAAPDDLVAVGLHYGRFDPVDDAEVLATVRQARRVAQPSS